MRRLTLPLLVTWCVSAMSCGGDDAPPAAPRILELFSSERAVSRGRPVTVSWLVDADRIVLTQLPDVTLVESAEREGSLRTEPIVGNTTFEMVAYRGERQVSRRITVTYLGSQADVEILSFDASRDVVSPGEDVVLSWRVVNASGANVLVGDTPVASGIELPNGSITVRPEQTTAYVLEAQGEGGPARRTLTLSVRRPQVLLFEAEPSRVRLGSPVTVSWSVALASSITVEAVGGDTLFMGADPSGTVQVSPTEDTTYLLTAADPSGVMATAMAEVEVVRPVQATIARFEATPPTADIGDPITLDWQVENASGGVEISTPDGTVATSSRAVGSTVLRIGATTTFTLRALSAGGDAAADATVSILPSPPYVVSFLASPNPVARGAPISLSWTTLGATTVEVRQGGAVLANSADAAGAITYPTEAGTPASVPFSIVLTNSDGTRTGTLAAAVVDAPRIDSFAADVESFTGSATVTLSWSIANADRLTLTQSGFLVPAFPATPSGTFSTFVARTTLFELRASNAATTVSEVLFIAETTGEIEPNDSAATAVQTISAGGQVAGQIAGPNDVDWYAVAVPPGGSIRAETSDGANSCALDTVLEIWSRPLGMPGALTLVATDDDSGAGACSLIDPAVVDLAKDLTGGRDYFVVVRGKGVPGGYTLSVAPRARSCGNGIREISNGEQCDDTTPSCNAQCQRVFTPVGTVNALGTRTFSDSLLVASASDLYRIDVPAAGAYLAARTYAPSAPSCSADTVLELFDRNFVRVAINDQSGADDCSSLHPAVDGAAVELIAGRPYFLSVTEAGQDSPIAAYQVAISLLPRNVCGNGVVEGSEACDDQNVVDGDGCSSTCTYPGGEESEPNDTNPFVDADAIVSGFGRGVLSSATDVDWFAYSIAPANAGNSLRIRGRGPNGACLAELGAADTAFELWADDGMGGLVRVAQDRDSGADRRCSDIDPVAEVGAAILPSASYFIRVAGDAGSTGPYLVDVSEVAPACGNGIREAAQSEQCDDGGLAAGDGCDGTCQLELTGTATVSPASFRGPIGVDRFSVYRFDGVPAGSALRVVTAPIGGGPCSIETGVQLLDAAGNPVGPLYEGGPGGSTCGEIPAFDPGASNLPAGNYHVVVYNLGAAQAGVATSITLF